MRVHIIIHASFEKPGVIAEWALAKNHTIGYTHVFEGELLPEASYFDLLVIMGGPQSPLELDKYPYLQDEIRLAHEAIQSRKAILGICLGAQIIGEALGAKTMRSPNKEVGSYPIRLTSAGANDPVFKLFPSEFDVMHWHNDMPGIAKEAVLLAHSEGCPHQAFSYGDRVYGLQFHMEMNSELAQGMIDNCQQCLSPGKYVRTPSEIRVSDFDLMKHKMFAVLDYLESRVIHDQVSSKQRNFI